MGFDFIEKPLHIFNKIEKPKEIVTKNYNDKNIINNLTGETFKVVVSATVA